MARNPKDVILIAVLGVTGAGKTTFISKATGRTDLKIGHGLSSCTQDISVAHLEMQGKKIALIDTPGFDDTNKTDAEVLGLIATYMADTYAQDMLLSGIILLQPINTNRVQGSERKRTRLFEKVCGPGAFSKVIIATTMWSDLQSQSTGSQRVEERQNSKDFWGNMVNHGAKIVKHDNNPQSARKIINMVVSNAGKVVLQMQRELAQSDGQVSSTSAGRQLDSDLSETSSKLLAELQALQKESTGNMVSLREEIQELKEKLQHTENEKRTLKRSRASLEGPAAWISALAGVTSLAMVPLACVIL
ncbi:p-loop containing nucleoside triphosphate hydrolase protein [Venustampulla echinocandica]|uniref:p-loop containing nucleoside triphosphate hydrolase protein n=1 Tax=Venustampulla echinocandica TaxID=2656787 RepID=A0A370TBS8_9HELO|nr:p-loop containing nucleoside triphosphate hydrolase protein [Venustampulla echinocandica]RDL31499.1 p-loop containing nucleoside triphosphate hydrolase protein [Venustampulla echinocandica]